MGEVRSLYHLESDFFGKLLGFYPSFDCQKQQKVVMG